jgi:hypothetical protein
MDPVYEPWKAGCLSRRVGFGARLKPAFVETVHDVLEEQQLANQGNEPYFGV